MTDEHRAILNRINAYAEKELGDIDPQKVPVSFQLDKLKPIMQEIADEKGMKLEEVFILYMDIQSEATCASDQKLQDQLRDLNMGGGMPLIYKD